MHQEQIHSNSGHHTGFYNNKYIKTRNEMLNGIPDNDLTSGVNYRVIRYADVLLMAAEAYNEIADTSNAILYLNTVRDRVGLYLHQVDISQTPWDDILSAKNEIRELIYKKEDRSYLVKVIVLT